MVSICYDIKYGLLDKMNRLRFCWWNRNMEAEYRTLKFQNPGPNKLTVAVVCSMYAGARWRAPAHLWIYFSPRFITLVL